MMIISIGFMRYIVKRTMTELLPLPSFISSILAGMIAHCISKHPDERNDGDEPGRQA